MRRTLEGTADVNGAGISYELAGEGHPLVLLHAGLADGRMWDSQFDALAEHYRVLRYDRRGFGRTPLVAGAFSHLSDLAGLVAHLGIERATLVGCSMGGRLALDAALEHPRLVASLVLAGPGVSGYSYAAGAPPQSDELERADASGDLERVNELELQIWVDGPHRRPDEVDPQVRELVREMNLVALSAPGSLAEELPSGVDAARRLGEISAPVLIVVGELDTPRALEAAGVLAAGIRGARLVRMGGTAHLPNMERPEEFNQIVLEFLNEAGAGGVRP